MRPPMVRRWSGAPSRGQVAPRTRATWRSPVWLPPRLVSSRIVRPSVRCSTVTSSGSSDAAGRAGSMPGPPEDLVGQQVADAGDVALVEQPRLERRPAGAEHRAQVAAHGRRARRCRGGRATGRARRHRGAAGRPPRGRRRPSKRRAKRVHAGSSRALEYSSFSIGPAPSTSSRPVIPKRRPTVAASVSSSRSLPIRRVPVTVGAAQGPTQRRRRGAALEVPVVGRVHPARCVRPTVRSATRR